MHSKWNWGNHPIVVTLLVVCGVVTTIYTVLAFHRSEPALATTQPAREAANGPRVAMRSPDSASEVTAPQGSLARPLSAPPLGANGAPATEAPRKAGTCSPGREAVAYYPLNGNGEDVLGSHSGAVLGAVPAEDRHGGIGGALAFIGGSDHVTVPSSEELNFGEGDFTIAFWLYLNDRHFERTGIMNKDSYQNTPDMTATGWVFNVNRGIGIETRQVIRGSGPITHARTPEESIQLKHWYHLAAVRQDRTLTLYVDGVLSAVRLEGAVANLSSSAPLEFGQVSLRQQNMNGRLDDVWIFRRALTREQVVALRDC